MCLVKYEWDEGESWAVFFPTIKNYNLEMPRSPNIVLEKLISKAYLFILKFSNQIENNL